MPSKNPFAAKEEQYPTHDEVVMQTVAHIYLIFELGRSSTSVASRKDITAQLEYEIDSESYVDVALCVYGKPAVLLECKSKREDQSASGWTRQIRRYEKRSGLPCILVVSHDLGEVQHAYLKLAGTKTIDLRRLK